MGPLQLVITWYKTAILVSKLRIGPSKTKQVNLNFLINVNLNVPVSNLLTSMAVFVPCDRKVQRASCKQPRTGDRFVRDKRGENVST